MKEAGQSVENSGLPEKGTQQDDYHQQRQPVKIQCSGDSGSA